jgi:hypothetical protein
MGVQCSAALGRSTQDMHRQGDMELRHRIDWTQWSRTFRKGKYAEISAFDSERAFHNYFSTEGLEINGKVF